MAQPPVSQQIKRLEQMLGHPLFERTTRGVKLTAAGHLLARRARSTMEKVDEDLAQVRDLVETPGDEAIHPVGGTEHRKQDRSRCLAILAEQQPDEHTDPRQTNEGDQVRHRKDSVLAVRARAWDLQGNTLTGFSSSAKG